MPLAVAVTELELELTVVPTHAEVVASPAARLPTDDRAVFSLPRVSAAVCCVVCWFLSSVCWFDCACTRLLMRDAVSSPDTAPEMVAIDTVPSWLGRLVRLGAAGGTGPGSGWWRAGRRATTRTYGRSCGWSSSDSGLTGGA